MKKVVGILASIILVTAFVGFAEAANVPECVKNNAGWWAEGVISENDFLNGIQYLIKMGIMQVSASSVGDDMTQPSQYQPQETQTPKASSQSGDVTLDEMLSSNDVADSIVSAILAKNNVVHEEVIIRRTAGDF